MRFDSLLKDALKGKKITPGKKRFFAYDTKGGKRVVRELLLPEHFRNMRLIGNRDGYDTIQEAMDAK